MVSDAIRQRFLQDPLPRRLGSLAADLARIASFAKDPRDREVVASLLEEGKWFAEWMAPDAPLETQVVLADIQLALAVWERRWRSGTPDHMMRTEARRKSDELLALSGLLSEL